MNNKNNLGGRFHDYILSFPDNEDADCLDDLFQKIDGKQSKKPDYFICNRSIFLEKKTLEKNPINKVKKHLMCLIDEDTEFRLCWEKSKGLEEALDKYSKGEELRLKLLDKMYKGFRNDVMKKANKQLKNASEHLGKVNALKGLLILNEDVENFHHHSLLTEIEINLQKKNESDSIDFVLLLSETSRDYAQGIAPYSVIYNENCTNVEYLKVLIENSLMLGWAAYNNRPLAR